MASAEPPSCTSLCSLIGASPIAVARASTPATSPRRWSTSATTSRCSAASRTPILDERVPLRRAAQPRHLQRLLPDADAGPLGAQDAGRTSSRSPSFSAGTFPEPLAFSAAGLGAPRAAGVNDFDLVQDNQCLGYGLLAHGAHGPARARPRSTTPSPSTAASRWSTPRPAGKRLLEAPLVRLHQDADPGRPAPAADHHRVAELARRHRRRPRASPPTGCTSCPWASTRTCSARCPSVERDPRPPHHHAPAPTSP